MNKIDIEAKVDEVIDALETLHANGHVLYFRFDDAILAAKHPRLSYWFALRVELNSSLRHQQIMEHTKVVLDSGDPYLNYLFALRIQGADINAHWEVVKKAEIKILLKDILKMLFK